MNKCKIQSIVVICAISAAQCIASLAEEEGTGDLDVIKLTDLSTGYSSNHWVAGNYSMTFDLAVSVEVHYYSGVWPTVDVDFGMEVADSGVNGTTLASEYEEEYRWPSISTQIDVDDNEEIYLVFSGEENEYDFVYTRNFCTVSADCATYPWGGSGSLEYYSSYYLRYV